MSILTPEQHGAKAHSDGGWDAANQHGVPVQTRSERFTSNDPAAHPAVTGRELVWKLTPVDLVRPLIDGELDGSPYAFLGAETGGAHTDWIERTDPRIGSVGAAEDKASANAWNSFEMALGITIAGDEPAEVTVTRSTLGASARSAHTIIHAQKNSRGHVVLQNNGPANLVENVEIIVDDDAHLTVVTVQEWDGDAIHLSNHFARVGRNAFLKHIVVSVGGKVVRVDRPLNRNGAWLKIPPG